jgi:hypothetical protein
MPERISTKALKRDFSPYNNPLVEPTTIKLKNRVARTAATERRLVDPETGEFSAIAAIHTVDVKDDEQFVKVFADGVKAAFSLNRTAARVFQAVLTAYQNEKMTGGFSDCVTLFWFDDGLSGESIGMSELTFNRGLRVLIEKKFIAPKMHNIYWVNPALFFKGDRVAFIREYRRKSIPEQRAIDGDTISQILPLDEQ